jgi:transcriptional regulator with XRE-family HTH domain
MRHVGRIERCESSATVTMLAKLADALGVTPVDLLRPPED